MKGIVFLVYLAIVALVGIWSVDKLIMFFLGKDIHWAGDLLIAFFAASITVPIAIILAILQAFGAVGNTL